MRIAFCGHSHHRLTRSHEIVFGALRSHAAVDAYWDDEWLTGSELDLTPIEDGGYDAIVVWQVERLAHRLARLGLPNVTFFPMYDSCHSQPDSFWRALSGTKILCFSNTLYERLQRLGLRARFARYFPEPHRGRGADHEHSLSGFFWQRQQDVTWITIRALLGDAPFRFTLHRAMDPSYGEPVVPSRDETRRYSIRSTTWFPTREEATSELLRHAVYFAPRLREGIGMSFLEAMAMGMLVVAPDHPTMSEYIVSGVNGLLYDPERPRPLDFERHAAMGACARSTIEKGREAWLRCLPHVIELVMVPPSAVPPGAPLHALDPRALHLGRPVNGAAGQSGGTARMPAGIPWRRRVRVGDHPSMPRVTVAVVTRNAEETLAGTLDSILAQDWPYLEVVVQDGASEDGTLSVIQRYAGRIDSWRSEPDGGPYEAMNLVASSAAGRFVLFMNAGDHFCTTDALSRALDGVPGDATFVIGHHLYRDIHGFETVHRAACFEETWRRLREGAVGWRWLSGVPGHQATLTRTDFLRAHPYRTDLRIAADHELLYRAARLGARFHHSGELIATYAAGGLSWRMRDRCFEEWRRIALDYTAFPEHVGPAFEQMRRDMMVDELSTLGTGRLVTRIGRVPGATRELKRRLRSGMHRLMPDRPEPRRLTISFSEPIPQGVRSTEGLSWPESWGRWTEGRLVRIELDPRWRGPGKALLEIRDVFGPNVGRHLVVRLGPRLYVHRLRRGAQSLRVEVPASAEDGAGRIEMEIPEPASPLAWGCGDDPRMLGVALHALEIRLHSP